MQALGIPSPYNQQRAVSGSVGRNPELVSNPGPYVNTAGWTPQSNTPVLSVVANRLRMTTIDTNAPVRASTPLALVPGRTYLCSYSHELPTGPNIEIKVSVNANLSAAANPSVPTDVATTRSFTFVATAAVMYVGPSFGTSEAPGKYVDLNYLSVRQLN